MLVEKERDELFDECDMLRNQVEELTNENKLNTKSKKFPSNILYFNYCTYLDNLYNNIM